MNFKNNVHPLTIDAYFFGNLSRFINHSCKPNLKTVIIHNFDDNILFGRISFFATRDIKAGEELTLNYHSI